MDFILLTAAIACARTLMYVDCVLVLQMFCAYFLTEKLYEVICHRFLLLKLN